MHTDPDDLVAAFEAAKERIRGYAQTTGVKRATLARRAGLHPNALRDMFSDDWTPRPETILKLQAAIGRDQRDGSTIHCDAAEGEAA